MDLRPAMPEVSCCQASPQREDEAQACPNTRGKVRYGREPLWRPRPMMPSAGPWCVVLPLHPVKDGRMTPGTG
jgi:hypothetical protein